MTEVKNIDISKDMLCYIITCRDRYPFFNDEMLQVWVEDKVRYAQQVINRLDEDGRSMFNIERQGEINIVGG